MEMKRDIIDSDNYFREAFKPIIEPLNNQTEKNTQPADEIKPETSNVSDDDNENELNSSFSNFFNKRPTSKRYDKSYDNTKRSNIHNNTTIPNDPFEFRPTANSSMTTDPKNEKMFNFTATPKVKRGSGLYKDVIPQTQLVYYDDLNELVTRLNLLTSSQNVGNTGVTEELHGPARKIFPRRSVVTRFKDDLWQADLIDMQPYSRQNNGFKFILIIIDTFTNKGYTPNWTTEVFTISKILNTDPLPYQLKDSY
ncbi:hypothetical protein AGLY_003277 [Aphis glycines]|uniref:Integrase catalytic domain-containing protein n=1 Tax=Aphis glycines TaxID=307491 RepID=A0A6G0U2F8_APHGL|nr:hypothetical protein AGLY_003277 [Aphis glycines]